MKKLQINSIKNAYGIKSLKVNVKNHNDLYQNLIYSSNGTFKTSFSRCLYELSNGKNELIEDRITKQPAQIDLKIVDDKAVIDDLTNQFIVFSREIYEENSDSKFFSEDYDRELEMLTIDKKMQNRVEKLISDGLSGPKRELTEKAKELGFNLNKFLEQIDINNDGELNFYIELFKYIDAAPSYDVSHVNLKTIFQRAYDAIEDDNFKKQADNYISIYNKRLKEELFDDDFNETNYSSFIDNLEKTNFISEIKQRGIVIFGQPYYDINKVKKIFEDAVSKLSEDPELLKLNQQLLKSLGTSAEAQILKKEIVNNPILVKELSLGRNEIVRIALKKSGLKTKDWIEKLEKTQLELKEILESVKDNKSEFEEAIEIYKKRFCPVFDIIIDNKKESMLGLEVPSLHFKYNKIDNENKIIEERELYKILSSGEKTTLNIIKFIVEYNSIKNNNPIIVLDDIVETFDYSNRYAFIEYINDFVNIGAPIIVLTHNFEFYRTVRSRIRKLVTAVAVSRNGNVDIEANGKINREMEKVLNIQSTKELLFAIPFLRETQIILQDNSEILNSCLHYKEKTKTLTIKEIINEFPRKPNINLDENKLYLDLLSEQISLLKDIDTFDIVGKMLYAIGCRLFLEQKIIQNNFELIEEVTENQFAQLIEKYGDALEENVVDLMRETQLVTPEFIHVNTFMYEPLIDIDPQKLIELYDKIINLDINHIWK